MYDDILKLTSTDRYCCRFLSSEMIDVTYVLLEFLNGHDDAFCLHDFDDVLV